MDQDFLKQCQKLVKVRARYNDSHSVKADLEVLAGRGITSFGQLKAALPALKPPVVFTALHLLKLFGRRKAVPVLLPMLRHSTPAVRYEAAKCLLDLGGELIFKSCLDLLVNDKLARTREVAAYILGFLFDERATDSLIEVLVNRQEDANVRAQAAEALGIIFQLADQRRRGFKRTAVALTKVLTDSAPEVRFWAAYALGVMRWRGALPELEQLAATDNAMCSGWWLVRDEASDAIALIRTGTCPDRTRSG
jgi:HEAT repeat protein